jgi:hypothetical protein
MMDSWPAKRQAHVYPDVLRGVHGIREMITAIEPDRVVITLVQSVSWLGWPQAVTDVTHQVRPTYRHRAARGTGWMRGTRSING